LARQAGKTAAVPLYGYQKRWLEDRSRFKIGMWARQSGKSFATSLEAVLDCYARKVKWVFLSRGERQSKELISQASTHAKAIGIAIEEMESKFRAEEADYNQLEIRFPNGSRIVGLPANPDTARGHSANVLLDEFAFHKDSRKIWSALYPTITRGYSIRIVSTPNGKQNKFYDLWTQEQYSKHLVDIYRAVREGLDLRDPETGKPATIDQLKAGMSDPDGWAQEYECKFIDEATAFLTYEMISSCEDEEASIEFAGPLPEGELYAGVDVGRKRDLTVIWVWQKVGDVLWTRLVRRLEKAPFRTQRDFLFSLMDGSFFKSRGASHTIRRCCVDSTGLGMQLAEEAQERFGSAAEAVTFTQAVKEDLAVTLRRKFEDRLVRIPADRWIRDDLHAVKKYVTSAGNVRFDAERTEQGHADHFWAAALGAHGAAGPAGAIEYRSSGTRREYASRSMDHFLQM